MKQNLKIYLDSLFINAPKTPANDALFEELLGNLCDRYDELCAEGIPSDEAYARVIGEVGDIRPLLEGVAENGAAADIKHGAAPQDTLWQRQAPPPTGDKSKKRLSPDKLRRAKYGKGYATAIAVMLYILWLVPTIVWGIVFPLFVCVALGTVLMILANTQLPDYLDDSEITYEKHTHQKDTRIANICQACGIGMLIVSVLPCTLIHTDWGAGLMFLIIALGVGMLILSSFIRPSLDRKLKKDGGGAAIPNEAAPCAARDEQPKKKRNRLILPVVLCSVLLVLTVGTVLVMHYDLSFGLVLHGSDLALYTEVGSATVNDKVDRVSIAWEAGQVTIEPYDGDKVEIYETNNGNEITEQKDELRWYIEEGHLYIRFDGRNNFWFRVGRSMQKQLIVRIPQNSNLLTSVDVDAVSANIKIKDIGCEGALNATGVSSEIDIMCLTAKYLHIDTVSGFVHVTNSTVTQTDVNTVSGNITLTNITAANVTLDTVSGEMSLVGNTIANTEADSTSGSLIITPPRAATGTIQFDTTSGDLVLTLPADTAGFSATLDSTSGDVESEFPTTVSGDTHSFGNGTLSVEMDSTSGNLIIKKTPVQ